MDNISYKELMDLVMADLRERSIDYNDDVETNIDVTDDLRSVADSTYAKMIYN